MQILFAAGSTFTQNHAGLLTSTSTLTVFTSFFHPIFCTAITSIKINTAQSENSVHKVEKFILIMISNLMLFEMDLIVFKVLNSDKLIFTFFHIKQTCVWFELQQFFLMVIPS